MPRLILNSSKAFNVHEAGAFLIHEGALYFATGTIGRFETPITSLIRGVWSRFPSSAFALLRNRIFSSYDPTPACSGMIKVAAKRAGRLSVGEYYELKSSHQGKRILIDPPTATPFDDHLGLLDYSIKASDIPRMLEVLRENSRGIKPVSALLTDRDMRILAFSWSRSIENRTDHAELGLIQTKLRHLEEDRYRGGTLWVSLRPCAMCSGQILTASTPGHPIKVRFLEEDPGPFAQNSCLVPGSDLWRKAGGPQVDVKRINPTQD